MILVFDMDGVIYCGQERIPGVKETLDQLRPRHQIFFLTNNSTQTREAYRQKLAGMGIESEASKIMTSSFATALYLQEHAAAGKRALPVGEHGIPDELTRIGMEIVAEPPADYVVVGLDRAFTYLKLLNAQQAICAGAEFIATNADPTLPQENGRFIPGGGSIVAAIRAASGVEPKVIGKPDVYSLRKILEMENAQPKDAVMIGDRLDTDIQVGKRLGVFSVLMLTGVTTEKEAAEAPEQMRPDAILRTMTELPALLQKLEN